jgi:hypothetical protein
MAVVYGSAGFPAIVDTSEVQFYYMESPLPLNAPQSVWTKAGTEFGAFVSTHCGIGVYDTSTSSKFSIEFIAANYTGALLPTLIGNSSMVWNNVGELAVTSPFQESSWIVSRLVSITSGTAYRELVEYLQTHWQRGNYFQPVTVTSSLSTSTVTVAPTNSYSFCADVISQISSFGAPVDSFLPPSTTAFTYYASSAEPPKVVSWSEAAVPQEVVQYYRRLSLCYHDAFASTSTGGAAQFLQLLQDGCYKSRHALVFRSATSVYNVSLAAAPATPALIRAPYVLPETAPAAPLSISLSDTVFIVVLLAMTVCGLAAVVKSLFFVPKTRIHLEQEKMADEAVGAILLGDQHGGYPHTPSEADRQLFEYFYPQKWTWENYLPKLFWKSAGSGARTGAAGGGFETLSSRDLKKEYKKHHQQQQIEQQQQNRGSLNPFDHRGVLSYSPLKGDEGGGGSRVVI